MAHLLQRWLLFFLFYQFIELSLSRMDPDLVIGILGESVIFPVAIPKGKQITHILWSSQRSLAIIEPGKKGNSTHIIVINPYYKGRVNFFNRSFSYATQISQLKMEDAGEYIAEITVENITDPIKKSFRLLIYERLTEPKIALDPWISDNGTCLINLTCSVEQLRQNVTYIWMAMGKSTNVSSEGSIFSIIWKHDDHDLNYTCTARNSVSNSSSTILAREPCTGIGHLQIHIQVLSFMVPTILLILLILCLSFWHIQRDKEKEADRRDQKSAIYDSITNLRPSTAEDVAYATVTKPKKKVPENLEKVNTLYDTLQNAKSMGESDILENIPESPGKLD